MLDNPTKKTISGEDLAIAIQFSMQFPENRSLAFSTGIPLDSTDAELNHVLKRMSDAADTLDASYRLRAMRKYEEVLIHEVHTNRQQIANYEEQAAVAFEASGRKGPLRLTASQEAAIRGFKTTGERHELNLKKHREEMAELEQRLQAR